MLRVNRKSIKQTWAEPFEMNAKVKLVSNFVVGKESHFSFDTYEAQKVSEHRVVQRIKLYIDSPHGSSSLSNGLVYGSCTD